MLHVTGFGDLNSIATHQNVSNNLPGLAGSGSSTNLLQPSAPGLMRSKSDHRLATQFRSQDERGYDRYGEADDSLSTPRKFGERYGRQGQTSGGLYGDRFNRSDYGSEYEGSYDTEPKRPSYRSRFRRDRDSEPECDSGQSRSVRFSEPQNKERERVFDTEDAARGPLSGITRLYDSPRVMQRLQEMGKEKKKVEVKPEPPPPIQKFQPPKRAQRQISEEDEITRMKKQNKASANEQNQPEAKSSADRTTVLRKGNSHDGEERSSASTREETTGRKTTPMPEV